MVKCREAIEATCGNSCCCLECEKQRDCKDVCDFVASEKVTDAKTCSSAIVEGYELQAFESGAIAIIQKIADIATQKKELEEQDKLVRMQLEDAMELYGVKSFENDIIKVTYVEPTTRTSVDSAKLKKKYPDIYTECSKTSEVKGSVRISVK